jgi:hypothetical protein
VSETNPPAMSRDSDDFKLRLYRQAIMALCKANGGTLKVEKFMDITDDRTRGEKGTLMNRALPGGGWEFKYIPDSEIARA